MLTRDGERAIEVLFLAGVLAAAMAAGQLHTGPTREDSAVAVATAADHSDPPTVAADAFGPTNARDGVGLLTDGLSSLPALGRALYEYAAATGPSSDSEPSIRRASC